jgi:hypothetical protein
MKAGETETLGIKFEQGTLTGYSLDTYGLRVQIQPHWEKMAVKIWC